MFSILNGPTPGGGVFVWFSNGVSPGTRPAKFMPSTYWNEPSGSASVMVISPVASSVSMPVMSPLALPFLT